MEEAFKGLVVLGFAGLVFSALLAFLSGRLKVEEDPLVSKLMGILPGINCGACGFSGCRAFAEALSKERKVIICKPGGDEVNEKVAEVLNLNAQKAVTLKAVVKCGAAKGEKKCSTGYSGPQNCASAHLIGAGLDCKYGCIAFGDCVSVCPVDAISLRDSKVFVDTEKCIGCGKCVGVCPRNLFELVPYDDKDDTYYVACSNKEKGLLTRKVCSRGCISCGICTKVGGAAFSLENNLSHVVYDRNEAKGSLSSAQSKCPTHCIDVIGRL